jgi:general secretion pathway protein B
LRPRQEIATRLAGDLAEFVSAARLDLGGLSQISVCGPLPELRSMAALLVERMDIEVEPLDTLFGVDPRGPSGGQLNERVAELLLAWAAAADASPALDLYRSRHGRAARAYRSRAAIAAGLVAGLGGGWLLQTWWGPVAPRPRSAAAPPVSPVQAGPLRPTFVPERPAPPPSAAATTLSAAVPLTLPTEPAPPPVSAAVVPASTASVAPPIPEALEIELPAPATAPPPAPRPSPPPRLRPPEVALPFDASLQTILFGPERRLAIVDGRIVGEGDEIKGARVVEITPNAVLLRDGQGRLRRLTGAPR